MVYHSELAPPASNWDVTLEVSRGASFRFYPVAALRPCRMGAVPRAIESTGSYGIHANSRAHVAPLPCAIGSPGLPLVVSHLELLKAEFWEPFSFALMSHSHRVPLRAIESRFRELMLLARATTVTRLMLSKAHLRAFGFAFMFLLVFSITQSLTRCPHLVFT
ncbi:hypothetical protein FB451DRAFT_1188456 [Mycena latifolia]|nr:hypothetical protein FB451DRAFT_1188456 [Mycena latifolia]